MPRREIAFSGGGKSLRGWLRKEERGREK